jgi:RNA polymerase sigma factor (sigma-70 family)
LKREIAIQLSILPSQNEQISNIVKKESGRLLDFIKRRIPDDDDARDVLQDVFYQLTESYRLMKPIEQVTAWLYTVTRNKITDLFRKKKTVSLDKAFHSKKDENGEELLLTELLPQQQENAEGKMANSMIMEMLTESLDKLPKVQREVFVMHEIDGLSFNEISEKTGIGLNTLLSRKRYAVNFLREELRSLYNEMFYN